MQDLPAEQLHVNLPRLIDMQVRIDQMEIFHQMKECQEFCAGFVVQLQDMPDQLGTESGRNLLSLLHGTGQILVVIVLAHHCLHFSI